MVFSCNSARKLISIFSKGKVNTKMVLFFYVVSQLFILSQCCFAGREVSGSWCVSTSFVVFLSHHFPSVSAAPRLDCSHWKATSPASLSPLTLTTHPPFCLYHPTAAFLAPLLPLSLLFLSIIHPSIHTAVVLPFVIHPISHHCRDPTHFFLVFLLFSLLSDCVLRMGDVTMVTVQAKSLTTCPVWHKSHWDWKERGRDEGQQTEGRRGGFG